MGELTPKTTKPPVKYSDKIADTICERLADGESLRTICLDDTMPRQATVFRWLADERMAEFRERYARAREAQADALFDEILDIADDGSNDWITRKLPGGGEIDILNTEHVQRSRLRIDARKWMAGKLAPKKYGDKLGLEHSGPDGEPLEILFTRKESDEG